MKKGAILLAGGVVATGLALAGAGHYVQDQVVPQQMATNLNTTFDNIYATKGLSEGTTIVKAGDITVTRSGLLTYVAHVPAVTMTMELPDGVTTSVEIAAADYTVTVTDKAQAVLNASGLFDQEPVAARMTNVAPVTFAQSFAFPEGANTRDLSAAVTGTCASVVNDATIKGTAYEMLINASDCTLSGNFANGGLGSLRFESGFALNSTASNDGNNVFADDAKLVLNNFEMAALDSYGRPELGAKIEKIELGLAYSGLNMTEALPTRVEDLSLDILPDNLSLSADFTNVAITSSFPVSIPTVSFGAGLSLEDIKGDLSKIAVRFGYTVDQFATMGTIFPPDVPTDSACDVTVSNVPLKSLSDIAEQAIDGTSGMVSPEGALALLQNAGSELALKCSSGHTDLYSASVEANHKAENGGFAGAGTIEARGVVEDAIESMAMVFGRDAYGLGMLFLQFAQPTADGQGVQLKYQLDQGGNLTVNGQDFGPVVPTMPTTPRP